MSSSHAYDSSVDARSESNSSFDGLVVLTPASGDGEVPDELPPSKSHAEPLKSLFDVLPNGAQNSGRLEKLVESLAKDVASLKKQNAECQMRIDVLKKQCDAQKKDPEDVQRNKSTINSQEQMDQEKAPRNIWREHITNLQQTLKHHKDMMSSLIEVNEGLHSPTLFDPRKIGFFHPDYNGTAGPDTMLYQDVELFIDAVLVASRTMPVSIIQENLQYCLLGNARIWYASVLTEKERSTLTMGCDLSNWLFLLRSKWDRTGLMSPAQARDEDPIKMLKLHKTLQYGTRSTMQYFITAVREACRRGKDNEYSQLLLAYREMHPELKELVAPPEKDESLNDFIMRIDLILLDHGFLKG